MNRFSLVLLFGAMISLLTGCGIPDTSNLSELTPPVALDLASCGKDNEGNLLVDIEFYGYNPTSNFSGYNFYIIENPVNIVDATLLLLDLVGNHLIIDENTGLPAFDTSIDTENILKPEGRTPSMSLSTILAQSSDFTSFFTPLHFQFRTLPSGAGLPEGFQLAIGATSISKLSVLESNLSNIIAIKHNKIENTCSIDRIQLK